MFLDDDNLPMLPEWEAQKKQLDDIQAADAAAAAEKTNTAQGN